MKAPVPVRVQVAVAAAVAPAAALLLIIEIYYDDSSILSLVFQFLNMTFFAGLSLTVVACIYTSFLLFLRSRHAGQC